MTPDDPALTEAASAVLDNTPINWSRLESSDDLQTRGLAEQLKILATLSAVHRQPLPDEAVAEPARWGPLQVFEKIGAGAFGDVYRAYDTRLDREVALKLLPAASAAMDASSPIIREGRLLARVRHPGVATIYGAELIDGRVGLWMEFVRGRTLEQMLRSGHQFSHMEVTAIGTALARAVAAVHAAGLLHRDIKAQNVMLDDEGRIVLMDFGTGWDQSQAGPSAAGTPLYLAPEIFRGEEPTPQSDVYSIGVVLFRLLTGTYPVQAASVDDLRRAHDERRGSELARLRPDLPPALAAVVERATAPDRARRYGSSREVAAALEALGPRQPRWRRVAAAGLVAAAIGATGLVIAKPDLLAGGGGRAIAAWAGLSPAEVGASDSSAARLSLVVLPFRNLTGAAEYDPVVDGLTFELVRGLSIVDGIDVRSATSSFALKGRSPTLAALSTQLKVDLVLDGSVLLEAGRWRVHAQLSHVGADSPLWTGKLDTGSSSLLVIQDEIALSVVNALRLSLGNRQRRYDLDHETARLYLEARGLVERRGNPAARSAAALFENVVRRDPFYAPAWAGLADAYGFMSTSLADVGGMPPAEALVHMREAAGTALKLDPLLAEAHAAMGFVRTRELNWREADARFREALALNPNLTSARTTYAFTVLTPLLRLEEAEALLIEGMRRDPLTLTPARDLAHVRLISRRYEEALAELERLFSADPKLEFVTQLIARAQALAGRPELALPYWEPLIGQVGHEHWMAYGFVKAGRRDVVERFLPRHTDPLRLTMIHTALGNLDEALDHLAKAADRSPHRVALLLTYAEMDPLRGDSRFEAVREKLNLR